jgi:hypothetical protein
MWSERLDNPAFGDGSPPALADQVPQFPAQGGEVGNLALHLGEMFARDRVNGSARAILFVGKIEQVRTCSIEKPRSRARRTKLSRLRCSVP